MSNFSHASPVKAYSMLNTRRKYGSLPIIININNLPKFKSCSIKYNENCSNESKNNYQNDNVCSEESNNLSHLCNNSISNSKEIQKSNILSPNKAIKNEDTNFPSLFPLLSPKMPRFDQVFKEKIVICQMIFNSSQLKGKNEKLKALVEINTLLSKKQEIKFIKTEQKNMLLEMLKFNIFNQDPFVFDENESNIGENIWEHNFLIYKIFNQFIINFPEKCKIDLVKKVIRHMNMKNEFIKENLFSFLENYTRAHSDQFNDIWKLIKCALINVKCNIYTPYCIDPIISYLTKFYIPKHIKSLSKILCSHFLPLFKDENLSIYFNKLINFIVQIVENNSEDQLIVIHYLIDHFPHRCGKKQPLFVSALIPIIKLMDVKHLNTISKKLFIFIAMAIRSPNSKLAESAIFLLMSQNMRPVINSNYEIISSIVYDSVKWSSKFYWDKFVKDQSKSALLILANAKYDFQNNKVFANIHQTVQPQIEYLGELNSINSKKIRSEQSSKVWESLIKIAEKRYKTPNLSKSILKIKIDFAKEVTSKEFRTFLEN